MTVPRVIIYAKPDEMSLAARMASSLMAPDYEWPEDGLTVFEYGDQYRFAARRNKSGFTIYSQQLRSAPELKEGGL